MCVWTRVAFKSIRPSMAHHGLDEPDVGAAFKHQRGHGVAEQVAGAGLADAGVLDLAADQLGQIPEHERLAGVRQEDRALVRLGGQQRPGFPGILADPGRGTAADRDHPVFLALPLTDENGAAFRVHVPELEIRQLEAPTGPAGPRPEDRERTRPERDHSVQQVARPEPSSPGRGGAQHKYLHQLVKRLAESQGYRATIEKEILGGVGKIDIALEQDEEKIACEISVTSSGRHELGNVQKCLAAGYRPTMYCPPTRRL